MSRRSNRTRRERSWAQVQKITGAGVHDLPAFFRNGLYSLVRAGLPDCEIIRAFGRCRGWTAAAKKNGGIGECDCGCGTQYPMDAVNMQGVSVWNLDHDKHRKLFRGVLTAKCNREIGTGDRRRKLAHASYVLAHEARLPEHLAEHFETDNDWLKPGALPD